jgi:hypothetical protein
MLQFDSHWTNFPEFAVCKIYKTCWNKKFLLKLIKIRDAWCKWSPWSIHYNILGSERGKSCRDIANKMSCCTVDPSTRYGQINSHARNKERSHRLCLYSHRAEKFHSLCCVTQITIKMFTFLYPSEINHKLHHTCSRWICGLSFLKVFTLHHVSNN